MPDLTEFLLARITEDETTASRLSAEGIAIENGRVLREPYVAGELAGDSSPYLTDSWNPARVLAECKAKRRIIEMLDDPIFTGPPPIWTDSWLADDPCTDYREAASAVLPLLALPYADHPDYDPSWRVE